MKRTRPVSIWKAPFVRALFGFASISTAILSAIGVSLWNWREYNIRSKPYYVETMKIWKDSKTARFLIGEPIRLKYIELFNRETYIGSQKAKFFIPFTGANYDGRMNVSAILENDDWILKELSLELNKDLADKKFIVYREKKEGGSDDQKTKNQTSEDPKAADRKSLDKKSEIVNNEATKNDKVMTDNKKVKTKNESSSTNKSSAD